MGRRNVTKSPKSSTPSAGIRPREGQGLAGPGRPRPASGERGFHQKLPVAHVDAVRPVLPISKAGPGSFCARRRFLSLLMAPTFIYIFPLCLFFYARLMISDEENLRVPLREAQFGPTLSLDGLFFE